MHDSYHLLIVEDNPADIKLIERMLKKEPRFEVHLRSCERLEEVETLDHMCFHLCLLDLSLPDSFGLETLHRFQALAPDIPVIVLTGQDNNQLGVDLLNAGAMDYLPKTGLESSFLIRSILHSLERSKLRKELENKNKELNDFATMASHDLKAPLSRILMLHKLLEIDELSESAEENFEIITKISEQISEMGDLIDSLLEYARALNKPLALELTPLDQVISAAYENVEKEALENNAKIEIGEMPSLYMDVIAMTQVFQNLFSNSIKYRSEATPVISVMSSSSENEVSICFKDNGKGFTKEQLKSVFQPFKRFVSVNDIPGSGIGMSVCQKSVMRHQGKIWIESEGLGKGTSVMIKLPLDLENPS
jgi:signal transduction histidine kinase